MHNHFKQTIWEKYRGLIVFGILMSVTTILYVTFPELGEINKSKIADKYYGIYYNGRDSFTINEDFTFEWRRIHPTRNMNKPNIFITGEWEVNFQAKGMATVLKVIRNQLGWGGKGKEPPSHQNVNSKRIHLNINSLTKKPAVRIADRKYYQR